MQVQGFRHKALDAHGAWPRRWDLGINQKKA